MTRFEIAKKYRTQAEGYVYTVQGRNSSQLLIKGPLGLSKRLNIDTVDGVEQVRPISGSETVLRADAEVTQ